MALLQIDFYSRSLIRTVTMQVVLPTDKYTPSGGPVYPIKPLRTLYLLHGFMGNHTDWISRTRVQKWAEENNLAVVMPSGENSFYVDKKAAHTEYGEFIGSELIDFTRRTFPLSHKREDTFIAGLSMGGYGAVRNGLKYHKTFSRIGSFSAAFLLNQLKQIDDPSMIKNPLFSRTYVEALFGDLDQIPGSDMDYKSLIQNLKEQNAQIPKMFICCGTEDDLLPDNRDYVSFLKDQEIDFDYEESPGEHDWDFWDTYIKKFIDWLPNN